MNKKVKDFYLNEIERYIQFLKKLTQSQLAQLKEEDARIDFVFVGNKMERPIVDNSENKEYVGILMKIEEMGSKQEVENYFRTLSLKRPDLETLCKMKGIPYTKRDNMSVLMDKIFERMVGFKLRSRAIQNDKL